MPPAQHPQALRDALGVHPTFVPIVEMAVLAASRAVSVLQQPPRRAAFRLPILPSDAMLSATRVLAAASRAPASPPPRSNTPSATPPSSSDLSSSPRRARRLLVIGGGISARLRSEAAEAGKVAVVWDVAYEGSTHSPGRHLNRHFLRRHRGGGIRDTQVAGDFLCDDAAVGLCAARPRRRDQLIGRRRVHPASRRLHLAGEGGHSKRRIVHAADMTGKEIERALLESARVSASAFYEHHAAVTSPSRRTNPIGPPLMRGHWVYVDRTAPSSVSSPARCSSPRAAPVSSFRAQPTRGEHRRPSVAMAVRARANVANMEFFQFHPTSLYRPRRGVQKIAGENAFLITRLCGDTAGDCTTATASVSCVDTATLELRLATWSREPSTAKLNRR